MPYADSANTERPYQSGSDTSHDAAVAAEVFSGNQGERYLEWLIARGDHGGTDEEAAATKALKACRSSVCARRNAWVKQGLVIKTDRRRGGCAVWRYRTEEEQMEATDETRDERLGLGEATEIAEAPAVDEQELGRRLDEAADPPAPSSQADGAADDDGA